MLTPNAIDGGMGQRALPSVAVVYLARGANDPSALENFFASYDRHGAAWPHDLVVAFKGYDDEERLRQDVKRSETAGAKVLPLDSDEGFDLAAYRRCAEALGHDVFVFLNSFSEILVDGWLRHLISALLRDGMGLVGASGSWESISTASFLRFRQHPHADVRGRYRDLWKGLRELSKFPMFPNPHVRSNAFAIRRADFLSLSWPNDMTDKEQLHAFESGRSGLTRQIQHRGLAVAVVGANGEVYSPERWSESRTFRLGGQDNLLVGDNRTREFSASDSDIRAWLAVTAWGRALATPPRRSRGAR